MKLTEKLNDVIVVNEKKFYINLAFDKVLKSFELFKDKRIHDYYKIDIAIKMFVTNMEDAFNLTDEERVALVSAIFSQLIYTEDELKNSEESDEETAKIYDLDVDAERIYASFMYDYGIDLFEQQGKMHWKKFKALLAGLSKDTIFSKVVGYRAMEVPKLNKNNGKEVAAIKKLKRMYALPNTNNVRDIDKKFDSLAAMMSKHGKR